MDKMKRNREELRWNDEDFREEGWVRRSPGWREMKEEMPIAYNWTKAKEKKRKEIQMGSGEVESSVVTLRRATDSMCLICLTCNVTDYVGTNNRQ